MWKFVVFAVLFFGYSVNSSSQEEGQHELKLANKEYNFGNYIDALPYYIALNKSHPEFAEYYFKLGVCYLNTNYFPESLMALEKYQELVSDKKMDKHFYFWYARSLHLNDKFDEAIEKYTLYTVNNKSHHQISEYDNLYIEQALVAKKLESSPIIDANVRSIGEIINSKYNEYNAIISKDWGTIYFTSDRPIDAVSAVHHQHPERIYVSHRVEYGNWSIPELVLGPLNEGHSVSSVELIDDGAKMMVHKDSHYGDLFISVKSDSGWAEPTAMNMINSWGVEDDAYMSNNGEKIIFASDIHTHNGDLDLYIVELKSDGTWTEPRSLGNVINSNYDEDSPFLSTDGKTLYFSSNGDKSMGGFDIFKSNLSEDGTWEEPINIGYPYNSPANDLNFYLDEIKGVALFSSQRAGGYGEMDIYFVQLK